MSQHEKSRYSFIWGITAFYYESELLTLYQLLLRLPYPWRILTQPDFRLEQFRIQGTQGFHSYMTVKVYRMDFPVMFQSEPAGSNNFFIIIFHCAMIVKVGFEKLFILYNYDAKVLKANPTN